MYRKKHNRLTARETCDIVRHIKPLGEVDFSGEIFFSPRSVITAWRFLCRALSESEPKAKLELSASHTCALRESEREQSTNLVHQVVQKKTK